MPTALIVSHFPYQPLQAGAAGFLPQLLTDLGYEPVIRSFVTGPEPVDVNPDLIVLTGSFDSTLDTTLKWLEAERQYVTQQIKMGIPILGICFGAQLLSQLLGGRVTKAGSAEEGIFAIDPLPTPNGNNYIQSGPWVELHGEQFTVPPGATCLATTEHSIQAFQLNNVLGVQFHLEFNLESALLHFALEPELVPPQDKEEFLHRLDTEAATFYTEAHKLVLGFLATQGGKRVRPVAESTCL